MWITPDPWSEIKHCGFSTQKHLWCFNPYFALLWVWSTISNCSELQGNASLQSLSKIAPPLSNCYHFVGLMGKKIKINLILLEFMTFGIVNGSGVLNFEESANVQCRGQGRGEQKRTSAKHSYCFKRKGATSLEEILAWIMLGELRRSWFALNSLKSALC